MTPVAPLEPTFRPAAPLDVDLVVPFVRDLYTHEAIPFDAPKVRRALEELVRQPMWGQVWLQVWLIELAGEPVGYLVLTLGYSAVTVFTRLSVERVDVGRAASRTRPVDRDKLGRVAARALSRRP